MTKFTILGQKKFICLLNFFMKVNRIIIVDNVSSATNTNNKNSSKYKKNVITQYLNLYLKTLNAFNSISFYCKLFQLLLIIRR